MKISLLMTISCVFGVLNVIYESNSPGLFGIPYCLAVAMSFAGPQVGGEEFL